MRSSRLLWVCGLSLAMVGYLSGCADNGAQPVADAPIEDAGHDHDDHDHGDHEHADHDHADHDAASEIEVILASLTPHEQEIAKLQEMKCIVADEPLGSMGKPMLVRDVEGHDFLICCQGCESELRDHPEKYIAKLGLEPAAEPAADADEPAGELDPS